MSDELPEIADIPEGWAVASVRSLVSTLQYGISTKADADAKGGVAILRMGNIQNGRLDLSDLKYVPRAQELDSVRLNRGDVLFNRTNSPDLVGKSAVVDVDDEMVFASYLIRLITRPDAADPKYLCWWINSAWGREWAARVKTDGVSQSNINGSKLAEMPIPVAPRPEQHRIVEKVEALLEQVNRAKGRLNRVPLLLKRFRQAVLAAACSGRLTNEGIDEDSIPDTWQRISLNDLLPPGGLFDGPFGSSLKTSDYCADGVQVIRLENIQQLRFVPEKETFISEKKYETLRKHTVGEGDIIFGSFVDDTVKVCILPRLETKAIAKADCFCIRPRTELVTKEYLALQLACPRTRNSLVGEIHGATRPRINTTQLRAVEIPLCPVEEQKEISSQVRKLFALAATIERRLQAATARANKLPQAILSKAFSGELVPTEAELARQEGRTYETAEELLKRVAGASSDAPAVGRGRGRRKAG